VKIQNAFRLGLFGGLGVLVALVFGAAVGSLSTILTYVGAALFLALGFDPTVSFLQRHRFPRPVAILTVLVGILGVFAGLIIAIIPVISDQVARFIERAPDLFDAFADEGPIQTTWDDIVPWLPFSDVVENLQNWFTENIGSITGGVLQTAIGIASAAFGAIIVLILTLYFVASLTSLKRGLYQLIPASKRSRFVTLAEEISDSVGRYVVGQVLLGLANGVFTFIFLTVLGFFIGPIEYSALLAFIAFLFSLIPLVGTITGSIVITLLVGLFTSWWPAAFIVAIYYLVYMQVEAYVLSPNIMRRAVKVPGVVVVIAALAGGTLLGILGALVAIPVAAAILLIIKEVVVPRQNEL
jgi:predicted PurR-regulated permease PerM